MTEEQKATIQDLCSKGEGYKKIAQELGLSENTIKSFCRRTQVPKAEPEPVPADACECCGKPIEQTTGRKHKRFCSDVCRRKWWNSHRGRVSRKLVAYVLDSDFYLGIRRIKAQFSESGKEEIIENDHEPLVSREMFDAVQKRRDSECRRWSAQRPSMGYADTSTSCASERQGEKCEM